MVPRNDRRLAVRPPESPTCNSIHSGHQKAGLGRPVPGVGKGAAVINGLPRRFEKGRQARVGPRVFRFTRRQGGGIESGDDHPFAFTAPCEEDVEPGMHLTDAQIEFLSTG